MKRSLLYRVLLYSVLVFVVFTFIDGHVNAQSNWLEKGVKLYKSHRGSTDNAAPSTVEVGKGLKEALHVGTENVVKRLGSQDGFNKDAKIRIPLPHSLDRVKSILSKVGMSGMLDDLELRLNRAAEKATPPAKKLFWKSITDMTFADVKTIYKGPDDAATQYFKQKMSPSLAKEMKPVVSESMSKVGAVRSYDEVMGKYRSISFVPDVKANLTDYVVEKGMDGIFFYIAREEAAIRKNPAKRTTALLKRVFDRK